MKRITIITVVILMLAMLLGGCGAKNAGQPAPARAPSPGATRETAARRGTTGAARLGNDYG